MVLKKSYGYLRYILKEYMRKLHKPKRKTCYIALLLLIVMGAIVCFSYFDSFLYTDTVAKIMDVQTTQEQTVTGYNGEEEAYFIQDITVEILNGTFKGESIQVENTYAASQVRSDKYHKGEQVFLSLHENSLNENAVITNAKRDTWFAAVCMVFLFLIIMLADKKGIGAILSLVVNVALLFGALQLYEKGYSLMGLTAGLIIAFTLLSLFIGNGIHRYTVIAAVCTFITLLIVAGIYQIVLHTMGNYEYLTMEYVVNPYNIATVLFIEILVGCLGAIVDASVTVAVTVAELYQKEPAISDQSVWTSIREVGNDIIGTMVNILFFTYLFGSVPVILLKLANHYSLGVIYSYQIPFELIRFLLGGIAILLTIPVTGVLCVRFMKKGGAKK